MGQTVRSRLAEMRERRELGSDWRAGRFPRDSAYALNVAYARRNWRALIVVGFVPTMMIPWALWATDGLLQGVVIGAALISGPWLALLAVISYSGAATLSSSAAAEEWTVAALRRAKGWRLVNDLYLDRQIDHVAIGRKGILVVETKWAAEAWIPTTVSWPIGWSGAAARPRLAARVVASPGGQGRARLRGAGLVVPTGRRGDPGRRAGGGAAQRGARTPLRGMAVRDPPERRR